jgi:hypothetical protein
MIILAEQHFGRLDAGHWEAAGTAKFGEQHDLFGM